MFVVWIVLFAVAVLGGYGFIMWKTSRSESLFDSSDWNDSTKFHDWRQLRKNK